MISLYQGKPFFFFFLSYPFFHKHPPAPTIAGAAIMIMSLVLFENEFLHIVSISFTALVLNELIMVALEITTWQVSKFFLFLIIQTKPPLPSPPLFKKKKKASIYGYFRSRNFILLYHQHSFPTSLLWYVFFFFFFLFFFSLFVVNSPPPLSLSDLSFVVTLAFAWKVTVIVALSALPLYIIKVIHMRVAPAASSKLL